MIVAKLIDIKSRKVIEHENSHVFHIGLPEPFIFWLEHRLKFPKFLIVASSVFPFITSENSHIKTPSKLGHLRGCRTTCSGNQ